MRIIIINSQIIITILFHTISDHFHLNYIVIVWGGAALKIVW